MTYHEQRRQAEELLRRNYSVSQVAKELGLLVRTVSRWAKLLREPEQEIEPKSEIVQVEVVEPSPAQVSSAHIQDNQNSQSEQWSKALEKSNLENRKIHTKFKKVMLAALDVLEKSNEDNILVYTKVLQVLSLGVTRHIDGETKTLLDGREDLITETQAFKLLEAKGYRIIDESAIKTMEVVNDA